MKGLGEIFRNMRKRDERGRTKAKGMREGWKHDGGMER